MLQQLRAAAIRAAMKQDWLVRIASRPRAADLAAGLDPQIAAVLEYQRRARMPPLESMTPAKARAFAEENMGAAEVAPEPMTEIIDTTVGEQRTPVRIFVPRNAGPNWFVWFHGGGGVIGSIRASEPVCRYLAAHTGCTVASVGYRLGPEDKHPAAIEDACMAWEALTDRVPRDGKMIVGGDSFGGFLAAHVDHWTRDAGVRQPDLQVLAYPIIDLRLVSPSIDRLAEGYLLTKSMMLYFRDHYLNPTDDKEAASPYFWKDVSGSAPAIVVTAGFDPLVEEGDAWAERLAAAGVTVRHHAHAHLIHGFLSLAGISRGARAALESLCAEIVEMTSK